ncbi:MAG: penicillin-binding protein 1A [Pseudomonadota bacterium]|nr:penicillin-binding protein 1A [Pseudomonadota bacterium]
MRKPPAIVRIIGYFFTVGVLFFVVGSIGTAYVLWKFARDLPDYSALQTYEPPVMTRVHAADGSLLAEYAKERRSYLPIQAIPKRIINAFIAAEDKSFYSHNGIDFAGIVRAGYKNFNNLGSGRRPEGASTITQQVAKNFLLTNEASIERKIKEALLSMKIERAYSKEKILELYLNEIYLGLGAYGVAAASLVYFDKAVNELTLAEAAYLAALPKAPNNYHPFRQRERAIERRNYVIERMVEDGYATPEEGEKAKSELLEVTPRQTGARLAAADYFAEEVRRILYERYGEKALYEGGLSVRTTLDPKIQVMAQKAMRDGLVRFDRVRGWQGPVAQIDVSGDWGRKLADIQALSDVAPWRLAVVLSTGDGEASIGLQPGRLKSGELDNARERGVVPIEELRWAKKAKGPGRGAPVRSAKQVLAQGDVVYVEAIEKKPGVFALRQVPEVSGGMAVMDPHTGRVLALVGGFSFAQSVFNRATQALRQPGSSFKPFVYAAALDNGYTPSSVVLDAPIEISMGPGMGVWRPQNYSGDFYGPSTLRRGIELSRNVMTVRLAQDMGMPIIAEYAKRFGVYEDMLPVLSMALGAGETTVMRQTAAYSMFANGGKQIKPTLIDRIQDRHGRTIYKHDERSCESCNATAWKGQDEPAVADNREQVLDPMTAYQMTSMLEGVVQRGTATTVKEVGKPLAGKTGTTNDYKDAWFVGFSPDLAAGVYIGYDKPRPMGDGQTGGHLSAPIFRDFMKMALADKPAVPFRVPPGMKLVRINAKTGMRAGAGDKGAILEAFKPGTNPPDSYSVIGYTDQSGRPVASPDAERGMTVGTGGLY